MNQPNQTQAAHWSGKAVDAWLSLEASNERAFQPVTQALIDAAEILPGTSILDIGCGTGGSTIAAARLNGGAAVMGLDVSEPMIRRARERTAEAGITHAAYINADAQTHVWKEDTRFDRMISRFGMMFFDDPVPAFRNICRGLAPGAPMVFMAWGNIAENPWFAVPARIVAGRIGPPPPRDPHGPGPFAFADGERVLGLMREAGIAEPALDVLDIELGFGLTPREMVRFTELGPIGGAVRDRGADSDDLAAMQAAYVEAIAAYDTPQGVAVPARLHRFRGRAG